MAITLSGWPWRYICFHFGILLMVGDDDENMISTWGCDSFYCRWDMVGALPTNGKVILALERGGASRSPLCCCFQPEVAVVVVKWWRMKMMICESYYIIVKWYIVKWLGWYDICQVRWCIYLCFLSFWHDDGDNAMPSRTGKKGGWRNDSTPTAGFCYHHLQYICCWLFLFCILYFCCDRQQQRVFAEPLNLSSLLVLFTLEGAERDNNVLARTWSPRYDRTRHIQ